VYEAARPLPTEQPHRNSGLFSDHYLNTTLPRRPDWRELAGKAGRAMEQVAVILSRYAPSSNEAQTEEDLVRPVLRSVAFSEVIIIVGRLVRKAWTRYRWETRPSRRP
jgi:hypothetical protein